MFVLGVDLGTTASKAALYDLIGRLISEGRCEALLYYPHPGAVEQELDDFYRSAVLAMISSGAVDLSPLITARYSLDRSNEAFAAVRAGSGLKVAIHNCAQGGL